MTQAFNLAQLANNLNTSGQLDATDGLNGLVANANLASSGTPSSTTFLRGDRTWATAGLSAASSAQAQAGTSDTVAITPLQLRNGLNASGSAPIYACRAWANINSPGTASIRAAGNISSISDGGVGVFFPNFTTSMQDANYSVSVTISLVSDGIYYMQGYADSYTTSSFRIICINIGGSGYADPSIVSCAVFR